MFYFSKCCFNASLCRTRCEFGIAKMFSLKNLKIAQKNVKNPRKSCFAVRKEWVNIRAYASRGNFLLLTVDFINTVQLPMQSRCACACSW